MENTVKKCQVDTLKNNFIDLYSKFKFLCSFDEIIFDFANDDFETFSINLLFFFSSLDNEFQEILTEFSEILND